MMIGMFAVLTSVVTGVVEANPTGSGIIYEIKTETGIQGLLIRHHPAANLKINPFGCARNDYYLLLKSHVQFDDIKSMLLAGYPLSATATSSGMQVTLDNACVSGFPVVKNVSILKF
ncbi:hypothetical protein A5320_20830 [Rheinheimera sp. SA_1]|nr:hypothetical protein A5320_20830 [Rheinheimera sp. SA_1]